MNNNLEPIIVESLQDNGYSIIEKLGSGQLNDVYRVLFKKGSFEKKRIAKIPKIDLSDCSINALINISKMDVHENEVIRVNKFQHPNIIEFIDYIQVSKDINIIIEEDTKARSLESIVSLYRKLQNIEFERIFKGVIEGLYHANERRQVLHRDITPANIFVREYSDEVKIGDWENSRKISEIEEKMLPTRGGTSYTYPALLNALLNNEPFCASKKTEVYSLGATMYFALTGRKAFNYDIKRDPDGTPIDLRGKIERISLFADGKKCEKITKEIHQKNLDRIITEIPFRYRDMVRKTLSFEGYESVKELKKDFEKVCKTSKTMEILKEAGRKVKVAGMAAALTAAAFFGAITAYNLSANFNTNYPTLGDLLRQQDYMEELMRGNTNAELIRQGSAKGNFERLVEEYQKKEINKEFMKAARFVADRNPSRGIINKRLCFALIRSFKSKDRKNIFSYGYAPDSFVPINFIKAFEKVSLDKEYDQKYLKRDLEKVVWMFRYINHNYRFGDSVEDIYTKAICTRGEFLAAVTAAERDRIYRENLGRNKETIHISQLAEGKGFPIDYYTKNEDGRYISGYRKFIPKEKRDIIDLAIALYGVSDKDGNLHLADYDTKKVVALPSKR